MKVKLSKPHVILSYFASCMLAFGVFLIPLNIRDLNTRICLFACKQHPPSMLITPTLLPELELLHLTDCQLPCWINIIPGKTTVGEARQRIRTLYGSMTPNFHVEESGTHFELINNGAHVLGITVNQFVELPDAQIDPDIVRSIRLTVTQTYISDVSSLLEDPSYIVLNYGEGVAFTGLVYLTSKVVLDTESDDPNCTRIKTTFPILRFTIYEQIPKARWDLSLHPWLGFDRCHNLETIVSITTTLLTTPDTCSSPCVWTFQPGTETLTDFRLLASILVPSAEQQDPLEVSKGVNADGITLQAFTRFVREPNPVAEFISVRLVPSIAQAAGVNIANFTPAAMIQALGNPDEAYLLFSKQNINRTNQYRLILVYTARSAAYVMRGKFHDGKACLVPEDAETITLYRFGGEDGMAKFLPRILKSGTTYPPTIRETTHQTPSDFTRMAQNPSTDCLTLK